MILFLIILICIFTVGAVSPRIGRFFLDLGSFFSDNPFFLTEKDSDKMIRITCIIVALIFAGFVIFIVIDGH